MTALTAGRGAKARISKDEQGLRRLRLRGAHVTAEVTGNVSGAYLLCLCDELIKRMTSA